MPEVLYAVISLVSVGSPTDEFIFEVELYKCRITIANTTKMYRNKKIKLQQLYVYQRLLQSSTSHVLRRQFSRPLPSTAFQIPGAGTLLGHEHELAQRCRTRAVHVQWNILLSVPVDAYRLNTSSDVTGQRGYPVLDPRMTETSPIRHLLCSLVESTPPRTV